jgi:hypothetical protein
LKYQQEPAAVVKETKRSRGGQFQGKAAMRIEINVIHIKEELLSECRTPKAGPEDEETLSFAGLQEIHSLRGPSDTSNDKHPDPESQEEEPASESPQSSDSLGNYEKVTIPEWLNIAHFYMFVGLVLCGIHVAA